MKYIFVAITLILLIAQNRYDEKIFKAKGLFLSQNAFETGCYEEAKRVCGSMDDEAERDACYDDAVDACPAMAKNFKEWLAQGKK